MKILVVKASSPEVIQFWPKLKDLSDDVKLELISLLSTSMLESDNDWVSSFAGKWEDDRSTEEILDDIYSARKDHSREVTH